MYYNGIDPVDFSKYGKTVAVGRIDEDAREWLKKHGCLVGWQLGIEVILLPKNAIYDEGAYWWNYTIHFDHESGDPREFVKVALNADAGSTELELVIYPPEEDDDDEYYSEGDC